MGDKPSNLFDCKASTRYLVTRCAELNRQHQGERRRRSTDTKNCHKERRRDGPDKDQVSRKRHPAFPGVARYEVPINMMVLSSSAE